jgi:light-regulated signal transduction histidine kinase (bacteriophytochrome)
VRSSSKRCPTFLLQQAVSAHPLNTPSSEAALLGLDNCADEPIHIPGSIQAHGSLLAFNLKGELTGWSANVESMLGIKARAKMRCADMQIDAAGRAQKAILQCMTLAEQGEVTPFAEEVTIRALDFDLVVHVYDGRVLAEFEKREMSHDLVASFASKAHQAINRLKNVRAIEPLLQMVVEQVVQLTGFARVMAYRFRHDDSGDVVAEVCAKSLDPYIGRRYPASDIPPQARRLYILNSLRTIYDVQSEPVPLLVEAQGAPLDLSYSVLRSVSPIHIEYLKNMGVGASMSVSIVVQGKLWGLIACHHTSAHAVPYSVRMACDVLAQMLAARVNELVARDAALHAERAAVLRSRLIEGLLHSEDIFASVMTYRDELQDSLEADALIVIEQSKFFASASIDAQTARQIVASIHPDSAELVLRDKRADWPVNIREVIGPWVGLMVLPFDDDSRAAILALRLEQVETVRWGGPPDKVIAHGPNGPRLTPRGSFEEWKETVRDSAKPWSKQSLDVAESLIAELRRASGRQRRNFEQSREQLLAMLGHDLRDPLSSITMAAAVLQRGDGDNKIVKRISHASGRMARLISDVLDMSRLQNGMGLSINRQPADVAALTRDLLQDIAMAYPAVRYEFALEDGITAEVDSDRVLQALGNLLSNARHHGPAGEAILVELKYAEDKVRWTIKNLGSPIPEDVEAGMFRPFKSSSLGNTRNRSGLGMGLYIAEQIAVGHGGSVSYRHEEPHVVFAFEVPFKSA